MYISYKFRSAQGLILLSDLYKLARIGEMAERSKAHAWKVCIRQRIEGSNPSLSAKLDKKAVVSCLRCLPFFMFTIPIGTFAVMELGL